MLNWLHILLRRHVIQSFLVILCTFSLCYIVFYRNVLPLGEWEFALQELNGKLMFENATTQRTNSTLLTLARNADLNEMIETVWNYESRFNKRYHYPWVFLNDEPFNEEFKSIIGRLVSGDVTFGTVPKHHWQLPDWIDRQVASARWMQLGADNVLYGAMESYHHMCRYFSGFFYKHSLLEPYRYYWRIEPGTRLLNGVPYDPFRILIQENKTYGFNIAIHEIEETVPSLWNTTLEFLGQHPSALAPNNLWNWISSLNGTEYSMCHFWSNFEIADLEFFKSDIYNAYFDFLDKKGGFFYERWGDAPVHSIALALFLDRSKIKFFDEIGYSHAPLTHCPHGKSNMACDGRDSVDFTSGSCLPSFLNLTEGFHYNLTAHS
ncbi:alpha-1,2-mannosyltransferase [Schizosaccharomyces japonicus yFS275]|uniref:Alpha-1,2-mannosyltransferase n=1 Tax=Schizosaccharomyces japonicus (strain yFS275 / FY16936) TaxID=402676 RepID=B6JW29_SCHJY|nr:alpha-1,2-mannosyltransferase [Schizosaccharomyces japonicus yFS275]EEB05580.1 alpha-1,2-mannosyltransferase [Schizosaccharomyces japonicus yFS275]